MAFWVRFLLFMFVVFGGLWAYDHYRNHDRYGYRVWATLASKGGLAVPNMGGWLNRKPTPWQAAR